MKRIIMMLAITCYQISGAQELPTIEPAQSLEEVMIAMNAKPIINTTFEPYFVGDMDVQGVLPIKLAVISDDELSAKFMQQHKDKLVSFQIALLIPKNSDEEQLVSAFKNKYPKLNFTPYQLDEKFYLMAHSLGIKAYPAIYENGRVSQ